MLERLGRLVYRRRIAVLVLAAFFVVFAITWGTKVFSSLSDGGFDDPRSESSKALATIDQQLGQDRADIVVIYSSPRLTVDDPAFRDSVQSTLAGLPTADVGRITSYWSTGQAPQLVSRDRHTTYAVLHLANDASGGSDAAYKRIADDLKAPGLTTLRGGNVAINSEITTQVKEDIGKAESLSLPILMVLLVLVFGSLAAASLPLAIGGLAILGAFTLLRVLTLFGDVSVFAINIVTMMGLGLAIDYALFVVSRFREELKAAGGTRDGVEVALARTMATAGRTVAFSGVTVAVSTLACSLQAVKAARHRRPCSESSQATQLIPSTSWSQVRHLHSSRRTSASLRARRARLVRRSSATRATPHTSR